MVTFSCDRCNDTVKKPKANQHAQRCRSSITCIDCSTTFNGPEQWGKHNSCISEAEAYQGALYKPTKKELKRKERENLANQADRPAKTSKIATHIVPEVAETPQLSHNTTSTSKTRSLSSDLNILSSVVLENKPVSLASALKLLKGQGAEGKASEKALVKAILKTLMVRQKDGEIKLSLA